jgi:anthranilate/para-aminobenzoate synthase component II
MGRPQIDMNHILLIDNFDSFTINLEHLLVARLGTIPKIVSYADVDMVDLEAFDLVVISPGPGRPVEYPQYARLFLSNVPVLGICLGMQIVNEQFGGRTDRLPGCYHGRADEIIFNGERRLVARYHSLYANVIGKDLDIIASDAAGIPMAVRHRFRPIIGYQFHPESFLTNDGGYYIDYACDQIRAACIR